MVKIDTQFSRQCADTIDSGNYNPFGENEQNWIENGRVAGKTAYGIEVE